MSDKHSKTIFMLSPAIVSSLSFASESLAPCRSNSRTSLYFLSKTVVMADFGRPFATNLDNLKFSNINVFKGVFLMWLLCSHTKTVNHTIIFIFFLRLLTHWKAFSLNFSISKISKVLMKHLRGLPWGKWSSDLFKFTTYLLWKPSKGLQTNNLEAVVLSNSYSIPSLRGLWSIHKVALCNTIFQHSLIDLHAVTSWFKLMINSLGLQCYMDLA